MSRGGGAAIVGVFGGVLLVLALLGALGWLAVEYGKTRADLSIANQQIAYLQKEIQAIQDTHKETLQELGLAEDDSKNITTVLLDMVVRNTEREAARKQRRQTVEIPQIEPEEMAEIDEAEPPDEPGFWARWWAKAWED